MGSLSGPITNAAQTVIVTLLQNATLVLSPLPVSKEDCDDGADEVLEDGERPVSDCSEDQSDDHQHGSSWTTRRYLSRAKTQEIIMREQLTD